MRGLRHDQLWALGGIIGSLLIVAAGWFLLINPQAERTTSLESQATETESRLATLEHRIVQLRRQSADREQYNTALAKARQALPNEAGTTDFLRGLQTAGTATEVSVSGLVVGAPTLVAGMATPVYSLPVTVTVSGTSAQLDKFLEQVQQVQARAALITSVNAVLNGNSPSLVGGATLTLSMQVFVAAPPGAGQTAGDVQTGTAGAGTETDKTAATTGG